MARTSVAQKLGNKIKTLRIERGYSQERLGEITGLDRTYISGVERGVRNPSLKTIEKIAKSLQVTAADLIS